MKNAYKQLFNAKKIDTHTSTSSIKHQDLLGYIVSSEFNQSIAVEALNMSYISSPRTCFRYCFISEKSNYITNIFVKSILVQKIVVTSIYNIIMSPEHFEIKNKELRPL